jgi:integrase
VVLVATGLRRGEILGLRWREVYLADPDGPHLRVRETWVRCGEDTPKSEAGERTISLGARIAAELFEHRRRTALTCTGSQFSVGARGQTQRESYAHDGL